MTQREAHPVAEIFPLMTNDELSDLGEDIRVHGLREPVWLHHDGRIIDGRNRARACALAGIDPTTRTYEGDDDGLVAFVLSLNLHRRHLNESQRGMVAARVAKLGKGGDQSNRPIGLLPQGEAADLLTVGVTTVKRARVVQERGVPELVAAVDSAEISVSMAEKIARQEPGEQRRIIRAIESADTNDLHALAFHQRMKAQRETSGRSVLQSLSNEWYTPPEYIHAARTVLGDIDLDPASCDEANDIVKAERYFTAADDGLAHPWNGRVWLNPPYGRIADDFIARFVDHYRAGEITAGIALVNAHCTDTRWFQPLWFGTLCFTNHRVDFSAGRPPVNKKLTTSTHGSVFVYFGPKSHDFAHHFAQFGPIVRAWP